MKNIKSALALAALPLAANGTAMPTQVPQIYYSNMQRAQSIIGANRPCSNMIQLVCMAYDV